MIVRLIITQCFQLISVALHCMVGTFNFSDVSSIWWHTSNYNVVNRAISITNKPQVLEAMYLFWYSKPFKNDVNLHAKWATRQISIATMGWNWFSTSGVDGTHREIFVLHTKEEQCFCGCTKYYSNARISIIRVFVAPACIDYHSYSWHSVVVVTLHYCQLSVHLNSSK